VTDVPQYFALVALLAAGLASIAIWSPRRLLIRVGAVALATLFLPTAWAAMSDLMSRPKPIDFEWWHQAEGEATVLSSQLREGDGVYLWLQISGAVEPRSYRLPWDRKLAEDLEKARAEAEKNGTPMKMRMPFERTYDKRDRKFYAMPQPALPDKPNRKGEEPAFYQRPGEEA
jgi:hypothetical protein